MTQNQANLRYGLAARWQRLPIRAKLFLPVLVVFIIALLITIGTILPTVASVTDDALRLSFSDRSDEVGASLTQFVTTVARDMLQVADTSAVLNYASTAAQSTDMERAARAALAERLNTRLVTAYTSLPYSRMRYLDLTGKQIVYNYRDENGVSAKPVDIASLESEGNQPYFKALLTTLKGQSLVLPPVVGKAEFGETPDLVIELGMPIYQGNKPVGVLIGTLRPRNNFAQIFRVAKPSDHAVLLVDSNGQTLVSARPDIIPHFAVLGDGEALLSAVPEQSLLASSSTLTEANGRIYSAFPINSNSDPVKIPWKLVISEDIATARSSAQRAGSGLLGVLILNLVLISISLLVVSRFITRPMIDVSRAAEQLAAGNFQVQVPVGEDEMGRVGSALNTMARRLADLVGTLETRVADRTRNLEITAEISRDAAQSRNIDDLLQRTINAIRDRFDFYHAQIFLLDDARKYAVLVTSTGDAGQQLLARKHKLAIGSDSVVGQVTEKGRTFITLDTQKSDVPHRFNPLLPKTRSEMALPMRVGGKVIGALDIQSVESDAFGEGDQQIFQVLADQIAIAVDNARLIQQSEERLGQVADLNRQLTRSGWSDFLEEQQSQEMAFQYDLSQVTTVSEQSQDGIVSAEIKVRGETVGNLSVRESADAALSDDDHLVLQAIADRVALAIENARLIEQSQRAAARIEQLYRASRTLGGAVDLDAVLKITGEYLATFDPLDRLAVLTAQPTPTARPEYLRYEYTWDRESRPGANEPGARLGGNTINWDILLPDPRTAHVLDLSKRGVLSDALGKVFEQLNVRSVAVVPLATPSHWYGIVICESQRAQVFNQSFLQFVTAMADQVAIAMDNRRLFESVEAEARRNRALAEAAQVSSQIGVDFQQGIRNLFTVVAQAANIDRWWFGQITLQPTGPVLERVTSQFKDQSQLTDLRTIVLNTDSGILAEVARQRKGVIVNDPLAHPTLAGQADLARAYGKHLTVPVRSGLNVLGILLMGRSLEESDLDERDLQLATALSGQIAVLMENQRLFTTADTERQTLQAVLNSLPTGVIVADAVTGEMSLTNELARKLLGLDEDKSYQRIHTGSEFPYTDEEFPTAQVLATHQRVFADDMTVISADGERTDLIVNAAPIFDRAGNLISAVAVFQDVSELRELENVLQDSLRETTSLYEISRAIAAENELGNILSVVASQVVGILAPANMYAIFRDDQGNPAQVYMTEASSDWQGRELASECPIPLSVLHVDELFYEEDISRNTELSADPKIAELKISAIGSFPLNARGRTVGWLVLGFDEPRPISAEERRFLSTLADQAAVAAENARLAQATVQALSETTLLYEASYAINRAASIQNAVEIVRDQTRSFAPVKIDMLLVVSRQDSSSIDWVLDWDANQPGTHDVIRLENAPTFEDIHLIDSPAYFIDDIATADPAEIQTLHRLPGSEKYIAQASLPLAVSGRPTGRLVVSFNRPYQFGRLERQFLTTLADQAAIVINNNMLVQQTQDSLEETGTLYQSSRAIIDAPTLPDVLSALIDHAAPPTVSWAMLARLLSNGWDSAEATVEISAAWERFGDFDLAGSRFMASEMPAWGQMATPDLLWIEDVPSDETLSDASRAFYQSIALKTLISVPLMTGGKPVGALLLGSNETWPRTEREVRIYSSLADQVAITIENRNLLSQAERRARQLQTSAQVAQAASSILNLNELLDRTVNLIKASFQYDHTQIFLVNAERTQAELVASTGEAGRQLLAIHHQLAVGSQSIIGQVTSIGKPQIAADTADTRDRVHKPNPYLPNTRSELALPLKAKGVILGALDVQSNHPGAFSEEDEGVLSNLADQIAIAIDNARLFELSTQRVEEMRFLFDVTRTATGMGEETEVTLASVAHMVQDNLPDSKVSFLLLDESGQYLTQHMANEEGSFYTEGASVKVQDMLFPEVMSEKRPVLVNDLSQSPQTVQSRLAQARAVIQVPLLAGENFVGVMVATSARANAYKEDTVRLLQTLSSTLAAIIQNAQLLRQVQAANIRLREVDKLKSQFLANMSHELRTPLNSIIGFSRVILKGIDGPLSPMQEQDLSTIHESGKHLLNLVNDILDQAKIEAGKMELSYGFFSVQDLLKSVMSTAVGLVKDKPVRLHQEIEGDLPQVWGDEFRSRQVLLNLVSNASKFTAQGSVTASAFRVEENGNPMVQISVTDTGIGIPEDKQQSIFEAFQQVESSTARQYEGTGLGLPIAKSLIEMQGGRIWVVSESGVGSTFSFTLPINQPASQPEEESKPIETEIAAQVEEAIQKAEAPQPTQRIILAIDDELSIVNLYRRYLVRAGYEIIGGRPEEAEELAITYQPRVILLDVNMPKMSGWEVLECLKDRDETFEIPVIICSVESDKERAYRLGAADYLVKPIEEQTLTQTVKRVELERDRRKILIIDDKPDSIRLVRDALAADERFTILEAVGGAQGLDVAANRCPDLIILDLRMPEMDGFAVLDQLRTNPATADIPVLVVTADDLTEEERQRLSNVSLYQKQTVNADEMLQSVVAQLTW